MGKKQCVVIQKSFFETLPSLPQVSKEQADIAWFLYDLDYSKTDNQNHLVLQGKRIIDYAMHKADIFRFLNRVSVCCLL